jgi:hypothetical protein
MARLIVPQRATNIRSPIDDTLPMTCVIESSYIINGHGVINRIIYFDIYYFKTKFRNIQFESHVYTMIPHRHGL